MNPLALKAGLSYHSVGVMYPLPVHLLLYLDVFEKQILLMDQPVTQPGNCLDDGICLEFGCK